MYNTEKFAKIDGDPRADIILKINDKVELMVEAKILDQKDRLYLCGKTGNLNW